MHRIVLLIDSGLSECVSYKGGRATDLLMHHIVLLIDGGLSGCVLYKGGRATDLLMHRIVLLIDGGLSGVYCIKDARVMGGACKRKGIIASLENSPPRPLKISDGPVPN